MPARQPLPPIKLISLPISSTSEVRPPTDLRWVKVEEWLQARSLAPNTQKAYRRELKRFLEWTDRPWSSLTPRHIAQFKHSLLEQNLAPASVNRAIAPLTSFFQWLRQSYPEQLATNPTVGVELEKLPLPPARDLSNAQLEALFAALSQLKETQVRDAALLSVLSHGLRASEVCNLNVADYDGIRLTIHRAKDDSTGTVPLNQAAREALNTYLVQRRCEAGELEPQSPLFLSEGRNRPGQRLGYQGLYYVVQHLGQLAGITHLTPHQLRHTFATRLLLKGMDSLHARTLTRHRSESSFKRYAKRALSAAAERAFYIAMGEDAPEKSEF